MINFMVNVLCCLFYTMMFNGLLVCGDSDTSDFTKESIGASSIAGSVDSDARSRCLENKLMATLEVLKNKEETVRVQAESLALAEARIAALAARAAPPPYKINRADQTEPLHTTRSSADGCCVDTSEVIVQAQEVDSNMVNTLRDNLSVIEELYRECFYETAKQEELIDMLRKSYLDMRLVERQRAARITRLQGVVDTQQWSLDKCQDIAAEVDNLKSEISNFLSSSNQDSGMWERSDEPLAAELADDLRHISRQLHSLKAVLTDECTCGLVEENKTLKKINENLEMQVGDLQQRISDLEAALEDKENINQQYQEQIELKDLELDNLKQQLAALEDDSRDHKNTCTTLNVQIDQLQLLLQDRSEELMKTQKQCEDHISTISQLKLELSKAESLTKENSKVREEVGALSAQVAQWREQLQEGRRRVRALDDLQRTREYCRHLEHLYEEKERLASSLQEQLEESRLQGAALCEDARRALCGVRRWLRAQRLAQREQEQKIKEQDKLIKTLQHRTSDFDVTMEPCCSKRIPARSQPSAGASETASSCPLGPRPPGPRPRDTSSEMSSGQSAPTPPRRLRKKPFLCDDRHCQWPTYRDASSQQPLRSDADTRLSQDSLPPYPARQSKQVSTADELLERVERTHEAFALAQRRWRRRASCSQLHRS